MMGKKVRGGGSIPTLPGGCVCPGVLAAYTTPLVQSVTTLDGTVTSDSPSVSPNDGVHHLSIEVPHVGLDGEFGLVGSTQIAVWRAALKGSLSADVTSERDMHTLSGVVGKGDGLRVDQVGIIEVDHTCTYHSSVKK
jgi:hypothetical protein